ncbi:MAG: hypothetical protein RMM29_08800 [Planctomycetota bacterium]|nr:hypothetical protein [Planctomycetota bacterium]MCX8040753.1 hypothetical protein [Planctomycetota bacterium]MDW8373725.1 hypothetical protein [Planctomycetota bacterium]
MSDLFDPHFGTVTTTSWQRPYQTALGSDVYHGTTLGGREVTVHRDHFGNLSMTAQGDVHHIGHFGMRPINFWS